MLLLHIGRGKAGSSTIQYTVATNRDALLDHGIAQSARAAETRGHAVDVFFDMQQVPEHAGALAALRARLDDPRHRHVFVSSEYMFTAPPPAIERLKQAIGPHDVRLVVYLRAYPDWLRSLYVQGIRRARRHVDFDAFYRRAGKRATCRAPLAQWADAFGWERMRIRQLESFPRGGLVEDLAGVLGCRLQIAPDLNVSPHWLEVEAMRATHAAWPEPSPGDAASAPSREALEALWPILREAIDEHGVPAAEYLTIAQHRRLAEDYAGDAAWLAARTDAPLPPPVAERTLERPFLPTLEAAPAALRETVARRVRESEALRDHPPTRDLVLTVLARHWGAEAVAGP